MISKNSDIEDIVNNYPELIRPLKESGLACIVCGEPVWGTLQELADTKNVQNLDQIIVKMNRKIEKDNP